MKAIIFGSQGQDGIYLTSLLADKNIEVIGVTNDGNTDLRNFESVETFIKKEKPDFVFHLAAKSSTNHKLLFDNHEIISTGTINILESVKRHVPYAKVFISGSALQFANNDTPINEKNLFESRDAYSNSRIHSVYTSRYYRYLGIKTYVGYFFNHDSPLRKETHLSKRITESVKRILKGSTEKIEIGDLKAIKEYSYAGDIVKAIWKLISQDDIFEAVIGSGKGYSVEDWVEKCFAIAGLQWQEHVISDENFISDYKKLVSDPSLIMSLGWRPEIDIDGLARMMMQ